MKALVGLLFLLVPLTPATADPGGGEPVRIWASNFRYCPEAPCQFDDQAYVRHEGGPVPATDNADAFIPVRPGDTVVWVYGDKECDSFSATAPTTCPGHEVEFEPDSFGGGWIGLMPARRGEVTLTWKVPDEAPPGHVLRYFCNVNGHFRIGVTGALVVAGPAGG
jgi:hypothetical protein